MDSTTWPALDAQAFLIHDIRFHRAVATASGNPILASLVEMVSALFYEHRRKTAQNGRDLKDAAQMHRVIYHAIRARDAKRARSAMSDHLVMAQEAQALEPDPAELRASNTGERRAAGSELQAPPVSVPLPHAAASHHDRPRPRLVHAPLR